MTTKTQTFTRAVHDGQLYITTEFKGTEYCLHKFDGAWGVGTRRLAMGRYNVGGLAWWTGRGLAQVGPDATGRLWQKP